MGRVIATSPRSALLLLGFTVILIVVFLTLTTPILGLYVLVFSMMLSPEIMIAQIPKRAVVVRFDDLLVILIFLTWFARAAFRKRVALLKMTPVNLPLYAYVVILLFSTTIGVVRDGASILVSFFYGLKYLEYLMIFVLTVNLVETPEQVRGLLKAFFVTALIVLLYGYYVVLFLNDRPYAPFDVEAGVTEPASLGGYLLIVIGLATGLIVKQFSGSTVIFRAVIGISSIPLLFLTQSRASYFALAMMLVPTLFLEKKRRWFLLVVLLGLMFSMKRIFPHIYATAQERVMYTFTPMGGPERQFAGQNIVLEQSAESRILFWRRAFKEYLARHPLTGHGLGLRPAVEGQIPLLIYETGLVGLFIFLWLMKRIVSEALDLFRRTTTPELKGLAMGFLIAFFGIFVQSLVNNTFIIIRVMEPFWFLVGLVSVSRYMQPAPPEKPSR